MLSRVADSIYWMSRYIERAENVARFIDVNQSLMLDQPGGEQWEPLVTTTGDLDLFRSRYPEPTGENVVRFLAFDPEYPSSILSCLRAARENARSVRPVISSEMWLQVNTFYLLVQEAASGPLAALGHEFFREVKKASYLFSGITDATMSRDEGWHFARMGRLLERADKTSRVLDVKYYLLLPSLADVGTPLDELQWAALLRSTSALGMYRRRHHRISPERVVEFLLLDPAFPRSVHYCVLRSEESLHAITGTPVGEVGDGAEQRLSELRGELSRARVEDVIRAGLHEFVDAVQVKLNRVGDAIRVSLFAERVTEAALPPLPRRPAPSQSQAQTRLAAEPLPE
jgi:uncharacterized alpha-E superfamily protein